MLMAQTVETEAAQALTPPFRRDGIGGRRHRQRGVKGGVEAGPLLQIGPMGRQPAHHPQGRAYLTSILRTFADNGIRMVRLDAVGYAIKKAGTSCFMMPETFDFIGEFANEARALGIEVLVEIHSYYRRQIEIAAKVDWVYDFALPPLGVVNFPSAACNAET